MYNIPCSVAQINNKCVLKTIGEVCSLFRDSSGCKRICSWTDHLHYPDHPTVSIVGCAKHLKRLLDYHQTESSDFFFFFFTIRDVNTAIMELLVMAYALKTSCAKNIIGVIPYFPYSKQCKMRKRGSIVCKLLASMLAKAGKNSKKENLNLWFVQRIFIWVWLFDVFYSEGLTHIITMDLHQKEIQGFFSFPVDNLRASPFLIQYIQEEVMIPVRSLLCVF